jgi:hypothetical protein
VNRTATDRMPDMAFRLMSAIFVLKDLTFPRHIDRRIVGFGICEGMTVADYGSSPSKR